MCIDAPICIKIPISIHVYTLRRFKEGAGHGGCLWGDCGPREAGDRTMVHCTSCAMFYTLSWRRALTI